MKKVYLFSRIKTGIVLTIIVLFISCNGKAFPEDQFTIGIEFRNFLLTFANNDTLLFKNNHAQIDTFILVRTDSIINNEKSAFFNSRSYKEIYIEYKQYPINYWGVTRIERDANNNVKKEIQENAHLISITKYPDNNTTSLRISFKDFRGHLSNTPSALLLDTVVVNDFRFTNYYKIPNDFDNSANKSSDIKTIYISNKFGIVAFQERGGQWWQRLLD